MKIRETKFGDYVLETNARIESVSDFAGTVSFIYLSKSQLEALRNEIWMIQLESDFNKPK